MILRLVCLAMALIMIGVAFLGRYGWLAPSQTELMLLVLPLGAVAVILGVRENRQRCESCRG